jgi:hypothetical protein
MNKFFANKDVLVAVFKLAPNPTEELRKFRFNKIMQMLEEAKGVSRQMYLEEGMPTIPEGKMESFIDDAIQSEKGMTTRIQNNWTEAEHRTIERSELKDLMDLFKVCDEVHQEFMEDSYSLKLILKPGVHEVEFLDSLADLKGNDFGRCIQDWCIKGAIKNSCGGTDLHRILSKHLSNVPSVQTLNKALRFEFEEKKRNSF